MVDHQTTQLANGLRIVTVEQPHLHSANVTWLVRCGSRHESLHQWGLTHLVEHMLFRGSRRFPSGRDLARAFERCGGHLEAATWRDHTCLSTSLHPSRLQSVLEAAGDMVIDPQFEGLDLERGIVAEELQSDLDETGADVDLSNVSRAQVWRDHAMGRRITGCMESLQAFKLDDVRRHHADHYVGHNAVLCVAGPVVARQVEEMAAAAFANLPAGKRRNDGDVACFAARQRLFCRDREGSQLAIQLTFEALPDTHPDFAALSLLAGILDDGIGSRLQQALCERRGLVYELTTGLDCYTDCGLYDIEMKVAPRRAAVALAATLEAVETLCAQGVTQEELELTLERVLHEKEFRIDSTEDLSQDYGLHALFERPQSLKAEVERLCAVSTDDIARVARTMFLNGRMHTTLLGPLKRANMPRIEKLVDGFAR